jgi:acetate kinase
VTPVIVVFNAGSSSLKFSVYRREDLLLLHNETLEVPDTQNGHREALETALAWLSSKDGFALHAAGHRIAHGKDRAAPARVTPQLMRELEALIPLAPLHQPYNLRIIAELEALHPGLPQIACFDTALHRTQPRLNALLALPRHFYDDGVKRYGFHGISYEYIASRLPEHLGEKANGRVIAAHLGNGASLCAMQGRKSVAASMGFSALDGLMMGTRCGALDPGVLLYLQQQSGMSDDALNGLLYHQSGLLGISGISHDMRTLEADGSAQADEAIALFCRMAAQQIGGFIALLDGLDALVFTGGIGENSARVRAGICAYFSWMGLCLDDANNRASAAALHARESRIPVYAIPTDEAIIIAQACLEVT